MNKKTTRILVAVLAVLAVAVGVLFATTRPETSAGSKTITVTTVFADGSEKVHEISTDAEYLYDAIADFVTGSDSEYGFFITGVDGYEADSAAEEWWSVCDGAGEMLATGVSTTPIADGDSLMLVLMVGYDF